MKHSDYQALDDDEVAACPTCGSSALEMNTTSALKTPPEDAERYRCGACNTTCDEFLRREKAKDHGPTRGLAARLSDADPDEVSR